MNNKILSLLNNYYPNYSSSFDKISLSLWKSTICIKLNTKNYYIDTLTNLLNKYNIQFSENIWIFVNKIDNLLINFYNDNSRLYALAYTIELIKNINNNNINNNINNNNNDDDYNIVNNIKIPDVKLTTLYLFNKNILTHLQNTDNIVIKYLLTYLNSSSYKNNNLKYYMIILNLSNNDNTLFIHDYDILNDYFINNFTSITYFNIYELPIDIDEEDDDVVNKKLQEKNYLNYHQVYYDTYKNI